MRPCVQYIGEMRLKSASCGRISLVRGNSNNKILMNINSVTQRYYF